MSPQLRQLRALRILLEAVPDGERRNDLVLRARAAVAAVKKMRESVANNQFHSGVSPRPAIRTAGGASPDRG